MASAPCLSPVTLSPRAVAKLDARKTKVPSWYLDLTLIKSYWGGERAYHHTAPINMLYALHEALGIVLEEGLEARFERHRAAHERLAAALPSLGLSFVSQEGYRLPMLNAVAAPAGVDEATVRQVARRAKVGNLYVNRSQIGAVVGVQPFGGEGLSGTGPKAGGPHYLHRFATERTLSIDTTAAGGNAALLAQEED